MNWIEQFVQDIRFGFRSLLKTPSTTFIAVLSAALGIGAAAAIFSVIYGVVLEPFPYKDVDSLMSIKVSDPGQRNARLYYSTDQFLEFAERSTIFDGVIASTISDVLWTGLDEPQRLRGNYVTNGTFRVMGVPPLHGRAAEPSDFAPDAQPIAVLGYRFWHRQFGDDTSVIGRQLILNGQTRTVVGIMPKRFMWRGADVYLPIRFERGRVVEDIRFVHVLGRLKPGVSAAQVEADLNPIVSDLKAKEPSMFPDRWRVGLLSFKETFPSGLRQELWILFGAVGLLLLIACANVSNLLLTKALARQKEIAIRSALGAGRLRIVRQLLTEGLIIALAGGLLGLLFASRGLRAILMLIPPGTLPDESEVAINMPVLIFALAICFAASLLFGLAPAIQGSRRELTNPLKESGRGMSGGKREALVRNGMVIGSVALSLLLLVGASLMIRTLFAMEKVEFGFQPEKILSVRVPLPEKQYVGPERKIAFFRELLERLRTVPGVRAVGLNSGLHPLGAMGASVEVPGNAQQDSRRVLIHSVNEGYLRVFGFTLREGRVFSEQEIFARRNVAVVNEAFARRYSTGQSVVGRLVRVPRLKTPPFSLLSDSFDIIGVVGNVLNQIMNDEISPEIFIPYTLSGVSDRLVILADSRAESFAGPIRAQVLSIDKNQPVTDVRTIETYLKEWMYAAPRFSFILLGIFAGVGLALAIVGIYGVVSNAVSRQTQEFGVRIALGATVGDITSMVMRRGLALLAAGIALGLAGSFFAVRLIENQIWKVPRYDWISFTGTSLLLLAVGLFACYWPARRASRVDPIVALRYE
jgi:predicted permease